jgi:ABC-type phosphate transport system substrate-binding protein
MKKLIFILIMVAFSNFALAQVTVIVHPSNNSQLDAKQVQRIFLGKDKKFSNGSEAKPVNQASDSATRGSFDQDVLGRSSSQVSAYWSKLVFTGKGTPPEELTSAQAVIDFVANNPDAIGYVDAGSVTDSVKAVSM